MKNRKKIISIIMAVILLLSITSQIYATSSIDVAIRTNKEDVMPKQEVVVSVKFENLNQINKGINAYEAMIEYDKKVFEEINTSNFVCQNNWINLKYNKQNNKFVVIKKVGAKQAEEVLQIKLTVREDAKAGFSEIKIKGNVVSEGKQDIYADEITAKVEIIRNDIINNDNNNQDTSNQSSGNGQDQGTLPQTGEGNLALFIWIANAILLIIAIYSYKKQKQLKKQINKKMFTFLLTFLIAGQVVTSIYAVIIPFYEKGEVSGDKIIDYADVSLIQEHLIEEKQIEKDKLENADMNNDGKITVTDLTILVQKIENSLDYTVTITESDSQNSYPLKGDEINLYLLAAVSYDEEIKEVTILGKQYQVEKIKQEGLMAEYKITMSKEDTAGVKEYKITEVLLQNNKKVKVSYTNKIDVLKDIPSMQNYTVTEDIDNSQLKVEFTIEDIDNAITQVRYEIVDSKQNIIKEDTLVVGKNEIIVDVKEQEVYNLNVYGNYNLDTDSLSLEKDNTGFMQENKQLQLVIDYKFVLNNIKTYKEDKEETAFEKEENIKLKFKSSNTTNFYPERVKVNGKYYTVTKNISDFEILVDGLTELGNKTITIEEVVLNNGKVFTLNETKAVEIIKRKPNVVSLQTKEDIDNSKLNVQFTLEDLDNSVKTAKVVLLDGASNKIEEITITDKNVNIDFTTIITNSYTLQVIVDYNLSETGDALYEHQNEIIYEETIEAKPRAQIKNVTVSKLYPNKQEQVDITYEIEINKTQQITDVIVNSIICPVTKLQNGNYQISIEVSSVAGLQELIASKVIFDDKEEVKVINTVKVKVDVLKDLPTIENYHIEDVISDSKVRITFDLLDPENSFTSGKVELVKREDNSKIEQTIQQGSNTVEFVVEEKKEYDFNVLVDCDFDTNTLEGEAQELNRIQNEQIFTQVVEQIADYQLTTSNIKTYKNSQESKYFERNEAIELRFDSTNATEFYPIKAVILNKEYALTKNNDTYSTQIDNFAQSGVQEIVIEKIILNNYKELELQADNSVSIEIIKQKPIAQKFLYKETVDAKLEISFEIVDAEDTITKAEAIVLAENGTELLRQAVIVGGNQIVAAMDSSEIYKVKVIVDYDLDTNRIEMGKNEYQNQELLNEEIDISTRLIQMKDIQSVNLYKQNETQVDLLGNINIQELTNLDDYVVKVEMKESPAFYTTIKEYKVEDSKLKFVLDYENIVQYEEDEKINDLIVTYGQVQNDIAMNSTLENIIKGIEANPTGTFELTQDINADIITSGNTIIDSNIVFKGTLNGNGYKIYNLKKPLFNSTSGATIQNIVIEDSTISSPGRGLIANETNDATIISNVHANNVTINSTTSETGTLVGTMKSSSVMEKCSATNITIVSSGKRTGGIVGAMANSSLNNCYTKGNISSRQDGVGGITGFAQNVTISNTYAEVTLNTTSGPGYNGGFVGHSAGTKIINSLSLSTGQKANRFIGTGGFNSGSTNNYELSTSTLNSNVGAGGVTAVEMSTIQTIDFYKNQLRLDNSIWDYTKATEGKTPVLKNADPNYELNKEEVPANEKLYIPDYTRLKSMDNYDLTREIAYHNLYKLMPFYDAKYLVIDGNKIDINHELNTKLIKYILPIDANDKLVSYLTNQNYESIKKIKVLFENNETKTYTVTYDSYYGNVASYKIDELNIFYNFNHYVLKQDASIISTLTQYIENLDYTTDLDPLTAEGDSRLYRDHFNESVTSEAIQVILKLLENNSNYTITLENEVLNKKIQNELITEERLKEIVYAYNYYKRWYNIEIGEVYVHDIVLFHGGIFNNTMKVDAMVDEVLSGNRATASTQTFYANSIRKYTGYNNIGSFLDYIITTIGEYQDVDDWFTQNYQGIVYEINVDNRPDIEYRAWTQLKKRNNFLLPFLTLPENAAYIVSSPTQFLIGAQRTYIADPTDPTQKATLMDKIINYGNIIKIFYETTAGFIEKEYLNPYADIQVDHRFTKNSNGVSEYQSVGTTEEPFHKNFNEAVNYWAAANGSAAYATGSNVYWNVYSALSSFYTWSHESAHNQDAKVFLKRNGRRPQGWAEDYADGNTTQGFGDGAFNFNISTRYSMDSNVTANLTPERINSTDKIDSYYREMFKASDFLDYIEAKAFLTLTPAEQAKVGVQIFYPNKEQGTDEEKEAGDETTGWRVLTEEQFEAMNLTKVEDLWDNHITIKPGVTANTSMGTNKYGGDSIYTRHWYQQHNDNGRPDSYALKQLAWEMLGIAGYDKGYVTYYSGRSKNDLDAIRKITNNPNMTWKQYKMDRYKEMEDQWNNMTYLDADEVLEQYKQALKLDAQRNDRNVTASTNVKRMNYHYLKRITNDFETDIFTTQINVIHIKTAQELQEQITNNPNGYFVLDNNIDVSILTGEKSLINTTFLGKLDGQGYKIIGNTLPLFNKIKFGQISNLIIEDANINMNDTQVGALARTMEIATLKNIHVINTNVGGTSRIGAIVGYATNSRIKECSSNATVISTGNAIGGLIGQFDNSIVINSYSLGSVKGRQDVGGFIGWAENSLIENSYSATSVESTANVAGGFIGQARGKTRLKNNISFANTVNGSKFDGRTANAIFENFENNYEYEESKGASTLNRSGINFIGKINLLEDSQIVKEDFYSNILTWNSNIWDYTNIATGGLPKLKILDPNNVTEIVEKIEINSLEDFLRIDDAPDKYYILMQNIDFATCTETDTVLKEIFTGKLNGNGYTLSNLSNASLFNNFRGVAKDLKITNFKNEKQNTDFVSAFSKQTYLATLKNIELENITLVGRNNVAVISGMDGRENANSIFEGISVKNANVTGTGVYVSTFIGRKYGGKINNCYVQGNLECYTTENGGIVGATHQNIQISNVISNVNINRPRSTDDRNQNGGFIGNMYNTPIIQNCISLGNMIGFIDTSSNEINVNKFTAATETIINTCLQNCYEVKEKTGTTSISESTEEHLKEVEEVTVKTSEFYKNILNFDEIIWNFDTVSTLGYPTLRH